MECAICQSENGKKCSGCGRVAYCCVNHQRQDWSRHKSQCKSWKVITDPKDAQRGRFVVANRKIKTGDVIFFEKPTLVGPRTVITSTKMCPGCFGKIAPSHKKCQGCGMNICSDKCGKNEFHQLECDMVKSCLENEFQDFDLLSPIRFLKMKSNDPENYAKLRTLVTHLDSKKSGPDWQRLTEIADKIEERYTIQGISRQEIEEAICILDSNSYQLISNLSLESFNGLYVQASMLNHTCFKANSRPIFSNSDYEMKVVATADIDMGQEINTNYLEPFHTNLQRRAILLRGKSFSCACTRCSDPTEFGTFASSPKCNFCDLRGDLVSQNSLSLSADYECNKCHQKLIGQQAMEFDNSLSRELAKVNRNNLSNIDKFIRVYTPLLSSNHVFLLQLKMWMIEGLDRLPYDMVREAMLAKKIKLIQEVKKGMEKFESEFSYLNGILAIENVSSIIAKLVLMFSNSESNMINTDPMSLLEEARSSIKIAEMVFKNEDIHSQDHCMKLKINDLKLSLLNFTN